MKNLLTRLSFFLAVAIVCLLPQQLQATHIVGGDMEYDILDKSDTEVTIRIRLSVYRDCFFGDPTVFFDDPAYVGIFNQSNFLVGNMVLDYMGQDDTLDQGLDTFCLVNLQPVCVHTTVYEGTVTLPVVPGGYTFAYQRCCRNETIANINDPLSTGATFLINVNDASIARANDSPEYVDWPPIYICAGEPLLFSHRATDTEDDSLVYSLCTPFEGGTLSNPQPIPTNPPPYDTVVWANGYSLDNLLGTGTPLAIDPVTGLMTGVPQTLGQFVIGVCVSEYNRSTGELLSIVRRDFQYNVNPCDDITANFEAPDIICEDSVLIIQNTSTSPAIFEWYLDGQLVSNSDSAFFIQNLPDTGNYMIELVAVPNTICADTFSQTISLVNSSIEPDFFFGALNCVDSTILVLSDQSLDTVSTIEDYRWEVFVNGFPIAQVDGGQDTVIILPSDVSGEVCLTVTNANNCDEVICRPFDSTVDNPTDFILAERDVCSGGMVALNPFAPDSLDFNYQWAPADLLDDPNAQNPIATLVDQTTTFSVTITNSNEGCETILETTITLLETPVASFIADPECGGIAYTFTNTSTNGDSFFWDFGTNEVADTSILENPTFTFPEVGDYLVTLIVTNLSGCTDTISELISVNVANQIGLQVDSLIVTCDATATITPGAALAVTYTYFNMFGDEIGSGPSLIVNVSGSQTILVVATDADGCTESQMVTIIGGPVDLSAPDTVLACGVNEINFGLVNEDLNDTLTYVWSPDSLFDPSTINDAEPVFTGDFGDYGVSVIATNQFGCADTADITLIVLDDTGQLDFEWEPDCSGFTIMFTNTSTVDFGFLWDFGGLGTSNEVNPSFTFGATGTYTVTLSTIYGDSCIASVSQEVTVTDVVLDAGINVANVDCGMGSVSVDFMADVLNETNDTLTYSWTFMDAVPATSNEENPTVVVSQSGDLAVSLTVVSEDSCVSSFDTIINVQLPQVSVLDSITICPGDSTELNPGFDPSLTYTWSPATDFDPNDPNPVVSTAGVYTVIVSTDAGDINCPGFDTIEIFIADSIIMTLSDPDGNIIPETVDNEVNADGSDVLPEVFTCGEEVPITANVIAGIDVQWTDFNGNPITTDNPAGFNPVLRDTVIAIASDIFGCTVADTVVIVNQQVDAQADPPSASVAVCATQDTFLGVINLDPNDTLTYAWEDNPIIISPLDSAYVIIVPDTEGTIQISVTVTNQFGCDTVIVFDVSVDPFISTSFPDTINACFDQPTELNPGGMAIAGYIYDWSPMNGDFSNPANPIVTVTMDQLYSVTITDPNTGCSETDSVQVIVAPDLMFTPLSTQDTSLCFPGDVTFMASAATNVVISWYDNIPFTPPPLSVGTNFTVSLIIDGQMETVYAEAIDTTTGCRDTLVFMAQLLEFDPNDFPDTVRACYDTPTELNPGAVPVDGYLYNWSPMDGDFSNPANPVVTLLADQLYGLTVTDPITGCELVDSILVIVAPDLMFEPTTTQDTALCFPDTVTFGTSHGPDIIVNWYDAIPFMPPPLSVSDSFDVVLTTDGQQITVYAEAVDTITGCRDTLVFMAELLEFNPNDFPDTVRTCYDTPTELNPGATPVDGYIYNWSPMDGDFSNPANPIVTLLANQTYNLTVTDPITGCELIDSIIVIVAPDLMLEPTTTQDTALCFPDTVTFGTNHGPDIIVNWYDAIPFMPPPLSVSDSFDVVLTTDGQQITVYAEAIDTLTGCRDTLVFMAELEFFDPPNYPDTIEACFGEPTPIVPDIPFDPSYDYDWTIDDFDGQGSPTGIFLDDTTIIVIVTDPVTGCFFEDTIFVNVSEEIALEIMPEDTILCLPDTITLTATNSANATVTWYDDEDLMNEIGSGMTIEVAMVEEGTITIYALAIEPEFGCRDTASTTVTLEILDDGLPAVNPQGCFGEDPVVLFPNGINPDYIYTFEPDDCVDLSDPANPLYICTESGGLTITVVNPETGCEVVTEVQVDIIDLTMLTGTATPDTIVLGDPTLLEVFGCEGDCMYDWMEPNGTIDPDGSTAVAIPDEDGTQIYIVEVTNSVCSEIVEIPVEVIDVMCVPERVYLPNAFSPNGDNINDRLRVRSEFITQIEEFELMIFNRWGQQMYRSFDPLGSWDGSFDGEQLPPDVYGYYLRVICPDGEELVQKGNITLLR